MLSLQVTKRNPLKRDVCGRRDLANPPYVYIIY